MCYHRFYIFTICGHSFWQAGPLAQCRDASFPGPSLNADGTTSLAFSTTCQPRSHPFQTRKLYTLCLHCARQRAGLLAQAETRTEELRFEEEKWRVTYQSPQADENAWRNWGNRAAAGRRGRMSDVVRARLRRSAGGDERR
ncbi:uncharacterized protein BKCO1_2700038 [Diplodia corticola]|uniref:Uncharacterized protein n=1 Tax=Diplodia corticola TaxID=236234 RepID=A0A1J9RZS3_9PEZI|nr:uncharacterized protein BKCO1_2700038 [Diplodia corticola]OJD33847.1 hypothetical protein BKCO1_2700038 [Diplodia corticola]